MESVQNKRFRSLDSLRGLAALTVMTAHLALLLAIQDPAQPQPSVLPGGVTLAMGSRFAVLLFFVLSGFVLALPYFAGTNHSYGQYLIRRFCRLYPPFVFAVAVAGLLCFFLAGVSLPVNSPWLNAFWSSPVDGFALFSHLLMFGIGPSSTRLDSNIWSLIIEARVSLIFPLLIMYVRRSGWWGLAAAFLVAWLCAKARIASGDVSVFTAASMGGAILLTLYYIPLFILGAMAASRQEQIKVLMRRAPHLQLGVFLVLLGVWLLFEFLGLQNSGYLDLYYGFFAAYLIATCVAFPAIARLLSGRLCLWLGDISYSLYLIHLPMLLAAFYLGYGHLPMWAIVALAVPCVLVAAHLMHNFIEKPSIRLGVRLAGRRRAARPDSRS